jgi:hypothetical protein
MLFLLNSLLLESLGVNPSDHRKSQWSVRWLTRKVISPSEAKAGFAKSGYLKMKFSPSLVCSTLITRETYKFLKNECTCRRTQQRQGSLPGKVNLSSFLDKGVTRLMLAAKVYLRRKSESTAIGQTCTAMLAGKVSLSRKSESTAGKLHSQIKTSLCSP